MMHCPKHSSYTGKRIPRNLCPSCWRLYCEVNEVSITEVMERPKMKEARASWLRENIDEIIYAPLERSIATASFITEAEIIEQPEELKEDEKPEPAKGMKI